MGLLERTEEMNERYKNPDNDPRGDWKAGGLSAKTYSKNYDYEVKTPSSRIVKPPSGKSWSISKEKLDELILEKRIYWGKDESSKPQIKQFLTEVLDGSVPKSIWFKEDVGHNQIATQEQERVFGKKIFESPKPVKLLKVILKVSHKDNKNSIILDFFAGSGTTGHAVLELNKEDGGNRQFILCTNNDGKIAEKVTYPRIKKVIKGYKKNGTGEKVEGLGGNLEYLKTEFVDVDNINKVSDKKKLEFTHEAGEMIALKEDCFQEVIKNKHYQVFTDGKDKYVGIYFRENTEKLIELEKRVLDKDEVKLYIFSHSGGSDWRNDYEEYKNVVVEDIPEPILKVYKKLNS